MPAIIEDPIKFRGIYDSLKAQRKTIEGQWQEIERFVRPYAGEFFTDYISEHQVRYNRHEIYDSTAPNSLKQLASFIHTGITNPLDLWFDINFRAKETNKGSSKVWLEESRDAQWMSLQESNFNQEINEVYLDLLSFGTSVIMMTPDNDDKWDGITFHAPSLRDVYFEEDKKGQCWRFYKRMEWTLTRIIDKFGEKNLPEVLREKMGSQTSDVDAKHEIFMVIYPRVENPRDVEYTGPKAPKLRPWGMKYVIHTTAEQIGEEGGFYEMPAYVVRWGKVAGSQWGHSPSMVALPDIKTLNTLTELDLRAREKAIDPAIAVTERGLVGDLDLGPGGLTIVRSMDDWKVIESAANFGATNDKIQQLQQSIMNYFSIPDIRLKESPAMTATEVLERREHTQRQMGPAWGNMQSDLFDPMLSAMFMMMMRFGQFGEMPAGLESSELDLEYMGPLARSLRNERVQSVETWIMVIERLAQLNPKVLENIDMDELARGTSIMLGVPQAYVTDKDQMEANRKQQAKQDQIMKASQMAQEAGSGMEAMGKGQQAMNEGQGPGQPQLQEIMGGQQG